MQLKSDSRSRSSYRVVTLMSAVANDEQKGCTVLVTRGEWQDASIRLDARVCGYEMTADRGGVPVPGCGRISRVQLSVRARGRAIRSRAG